MAAIGSYLVDPGSEEIYCAELHPRALGIKCVRCREAVCLPCASQATQPVIWDLQPIIAHLDLHVPDARPLVPYVCPGCWEDDGTPSSLLGAILRGEGPLPDGHEKSEDHESTDLGEKYRKEAKKQKPPLPPKQRTHEPPPEPKPEPAKEDKEFEDAKVDQETEETGAAKVPGTERSPSSELLAGSGSHETEKSNDDGEPKDCNPRPNPFARIPSPERALTAIPHARQDGREGLVHAHQDPTHNNRTHPNNNPRNTHQGDDNGRFRGHKQDNGELERAKQEAKEAQQTIGEMRQMMLHQAAIMERMERCFQEQSMPKPTPTVSEELLNLLTTAAGKNNSTSSRNSQKSSPDIKMKPIELGSFSGEKLAYRTFIKRLDYHFEHNEQYSDVDKMAVLRGHLKGEAAATIAYLEDIDDGAYEDARAILEETYGSMEDAELELTTKFQNIQPESRYEATALKGFANQLHLLVSQCRRSGVEEGFLRASTPSLLLKLPSKVRQELRDKQTESGKKTTVDEIIKSLCKHAGNAEWEEKANKVSKVKSAVTYMPRSEQYYTGHHMSHESQDVRHVTWNEQYEDGQDAYTHNLVQTSDGTTKDSKTRPGTQPHSPRPFRPRSPGPPWPFHPHSPSFAPRSPRPFRPQSPWQTSGPRDFKELPCVFCKGEHNKFRCHFTQEEMVKFIQKNKLCPNCLRDNHKVTECSSFHRCKKCDARHHTATCQLRAAEDMSVTSQQLAQTGSHGNVIMPHFQTRASNPLKQGTVLITALVDQGSTDTFIMDDVAKELKLKEYGHRTFSSGTCLTGERRVIKAKKVELDLHTKNGSKMQIGALCVPMIVADITIQPADLPASAMQFLQSQDFVCNAPPNESKTTKINLLLGNAVYGKVMSPAKGCQALDAEQNLVTYQTPFGTVISGAAKTSTTDSPHFSCFQETWCVEPELSEVDKYFNEQLKASWEIESLGIKMVPDYSLSASKDALTEKLIKTSEINEEGRWMIRLPFKDDRPTIHHNYDQALGRLRSMVNRLDENQKEKYFKTWQELLDAKYLEPTTKEIPKGAIVTHLPHFAVIKDSSLTTKIRPVLDAAAATESGACLNDLLHTGPQPGEPLLEVLIRFRVGVHAVISDIAKAFYAIGINEADRDAVRVLLPKDYKKPITEANVEVWRYQRLVMGATCSSFILMALIGETLHQKKEDPEYNELSDVELDIIRRSFYADNCILTMDTIEKARNTTNALQKAMDERMFHLQEYTATHKDILRDIAPKDIDQLEVLKILGVDWQTILDSLKLHENTKFEKTEHTRWTVSSGISSVYDPFGLYTPVTIRRRFFERSLLDLNLRWDDRIQKEDAKEWTELIPDLRRIHKITRPRNTRPCPDKPVRIVGFADASKKAYAALVYIWQWDGKQAKVQLLVSRAKMPPRKNKMTTLPKLELTALHCTTQLMKRVADALSHENIVSQTVFTDSQIAIYWAFSKKKLKPYEDSRVRDIKKTGIKDIRYVPTAENPADIPTRGTTAEGLEKSCFYEGPEFLKKPYEQWHQTWESLQTNSSSTEEITSLVQLGEDDEDGQEVEPPAGIKLSRYKSLHQVLRVTCYVRRAIRRDLRATTKALTTTELWEATKLWINHAQRVAYPKIRLKREGDRAPDRLVKDLRLYRDEEGLLRSKGRDRYVDEEPKNADLYLLPKDAQLTKLIVLDMHTAQGHADA